MSNDTNTCGPLPELNAWDGMTLRDYFAVHVPHSLLGDNTSPEYAEAVSGMKKPQTHSWEWWYLAEARARYKFADAMLKARNS